MRNARKQWDFENSEPIQDSYGEGGQAAPEECAGVMYGGHDDGDTDDLGDGLGDYGSDLSGCLDEDAGQGAKGRAENAQDAMFLLNETDRFRKRPDAKQIQDNFRGYVRDSTSPDPAVRQAAIEGACRDLEFFIMYLITRKFGTYVEKGRSFYEDLLQAGRLGIMTSLRKYDPEKSMPTTYFFNPIKHEMGLQVTTIKSDSKSHVVTTKRKIQEVDRLFEKYGRKPELRDYVYSIKCPVHRITNALAEIEAGNVKTSIDDPEAAPLADRQSSMRGPEESAMSNMNAGKILKILYEIEPRKEIVDCFIDRSLSGRQKTSELAQKYGLTPSEVTEGCRNLANLVR